MKILIVNFKKEIFLCTLKFIYFDREKTVNKHTNVKVA